ncbi:hypothetical protein ACS0PU_010299 [Formica fusca]
MEPDSKHLLERIHNMEKTIKENYEIIQNMEKTNKENYEIIQNIEKTNKEKDKIIQNMEKTNKEKDHIFHILYVGELAQSVKLFIRLKILDKTKNNKEITSLIQLDEMVEKGSKFLTKDEIKRWRDFRKKLERGNIQVDKLNNALKMASQWRNSLANPKHLPLTLLTLSKSSKID